MDPQTLIYACTRLENNARNAESAGNHTGMVVMFNKTVASDYRPLQWPNLELRISSQEAVGEATHITYSV